MNVTEPNATQITLWIDGDACPVPIKEIVYRTAQRLKISTIVVANTSMWIPQSKWIQLLTVPHGADAADDKIITDLKPGDIVVTGDIPLAARVVEAEALAIGTRGELYDDASVHSRLATRNLMEQMRSAGMETSGPKPFDSKNVQTFANQLDRVLTKRLRSNS